MVKIMLSFFGSRWIEPRDKTISIVRCPISNQGCLPSLTIESNFKYSGAEGDKFLFQESESNHRFILDISVMFRVSIHGKTKQPQNVTEGF